MGGFCRQSVLKMGWGYEINEKISMFRFVEFLLDLDQVLQNHLSFVFDLLSSIPSQKDHQSNISTRTIWVFKINNKSEGYSNNFIQTRREICDRSFIGEKELVLVFSVVRRTINNNLKKYKHMTAILLLLVLCYYEGTDNFSHSDQ